PGMTSRRQTGGLVPRSVTFKVMMFLLALVFGALATIFPSCRHPTSARMSHCPALRDDIADGKRMGRWQEDGDGAIYVPIGSGLSARVRRMASMARIDLTRPVATAGRRE